MIRSVEVLVDGLDHPEGVAYDHASGALYAGGEQGQLYLVDIDERRVIEVGRTPGFALGLAVDGSGRVLVCDSDDGSVWAFDGGSARRVLPLNGEGLSMPNFPAFGPDGTLYVTDSGAWKEDRGRTLAVRSDGSVEVVDSTLNRFPNGCAVTPDGRELWVLQSEGENLSRVDLVDGGKPEEIVGIPGTVPDGIALTDEGGAVISCYRPDRLYYLSPDGSLDVLMDDYQGTLLAAPTNVCFVGDARQTLVVSSLGRWHLTKIELGLTGVVPHAPDRWAIDDGLL